MAALSGSLRWGELGSFCRVQSWLFAIRTTALVQQYVYFYSNLVAIQEMEGSGGSANDRSLLFRLFCF